MNQPQISEAELQARGQWFESKKHSYELTQKLTYYVISVELVFCGYMLLNAKTLIGLKGASYLFVASGVAALFGILWRFFYNQTYHNNAHGIYNRTHQISVYSQLIVYWVYVFLSIVSLIWALVAGFNYLEISNSPPKLAVVKPLVLSTQKTAPKQSIPAKPTPAQENIKESKIAIPSK